MGSAILGAAMKPVLQLLQLIESQPYSASNPVKNPNTSTTSFNCLMLHVGTIHACSCTLVHARAPCRTMPNAYGQVHWQAYPMEVSQWQKPWMQ